MMMKIAVTTSKIEGRSFVGLAQNLFVVLLLLLQGTVSNPLEEERRPPSDQQLPVFGAVNPTGDAKTEEPYPKFDDEDYDSNEDGESCRMGLINDWLNRYNNEMDTSSFTTNVVNGNVGIQDSSKQQQQQLDISSLRAVQETTLYKNILEDCEFFLHEFNTAAGFVCVQEQLRFPTILYSELWTIGPINMDGGWLLAADLVLSSNLEDSRPLVPCAESCYIRYPRTTNDDYSDCQQQPTTATAGSVHLDITQITSISQDSEGSLEEKQQDLCHGWLQADTAYQNLRMCASESHVARTMISETKQRETNNLQQPFMSEGTQTASDVAKAYAEQRQKQAACAVSALQGACSAFELIAPEGDFGYGPASDNIYHDHDDGDWDETDSAASANGIAGMVLSLALFFLQLVDGW